jgi:hypothetical protein
MFDAMHHHRQTGNNVASSPGACKRLKGRRFYDC